MAKQKINWTLRSDYEQWAKDVRHTSNSISSYCNYLLNAKNCVDLTNTLVVRGPGQVIGMTPDAKPEDYLDLVGQFVQNGDKTYALTVLDAVLDMVLNSPKFGGSKRSKTIPALKEYIEFIKQYNAGAQPSSVSSSLSNVRNSFPKTMIHKIDGVESLAYLLGEQKFIKYAIDNSYSSKTEVTKCPYWEYAVNVIKPLSQNEKVSQIVRKAI